VLVRQGDRLAPQIDSRPRGAKPAARKPKTASKKTKTKPRKASRPAAKKRKK